MVRSIYTQRVHLIEKLVGETPLMALNRLREEKGLPADVSLSYAGRLDPMASGALLVLEGDECRDQSRFMKLDKEYRVEVLLGACSDTGDVLGIVTGADALPVTLADAERIANSLVGPYASPYPRFSSRTVAGKPLFQWSLEGRLDEIEIPLQQGSVREIRITGVRDIPAMELRAAVDEKLALVPRTDDPRKALGKDFRVDDARDSWSRFFLSAPDSLPVITLVTRTSSGVYMRTLADDLASRLGSRGLALSIHRTRIFLGTESAA